MSVQTIEIRRPRQQTVRAGSEMLDVLSRSTALEPFEINLAMMACEDGCMGRCDMSAQLTELIIRDVAIKLHRAGSGPKLMFLHGAGGVPQWLPFFDALSDHYEVLVPEHSGFGGSDDESLGEGVTKV